MRIKKWRIVSYLDEYIVEEVRSTDGFYDWHLVKTFQQHSDALHYVGQHYPKVIAHN